MTGIGSTVSFRNSASRRGVICSVAQSCLRVRSLSMDEEAMRVLLVWSGPSFSPVVSMSGVTPFSPDVSIVDITPGFSVVVSMVEGSGVTPFPSVYAPTREPAALPIPGSPGDDTANVAQHGGEATGLG